MNRPRVLGAITARDEIDVPNASLDPKYKDVIVVHAGETLSWKQISVANLSLILFGQKMEESLKKQLPEWKSSLLFRGQTLVVKDCIM